MPLQNLKTLLASPHDDRLLAELVSSSSAAQVLSFLRKAAPDLASIPPTTYTLYRQFENSGYRRGYERQYFARRSMLTRAVVELILGDPSMRDTVHDLLWSICEETSWVLPAHEEQGPEFWELHPSPRQRLWGAHTALTREPDAIDLFAAETGASLAETVYLLEGRLAPEVVQRVRQEVQRRIFQPYLAYGRKHWWYKGALNWNGVCNGSIGLAFLRLEKDPQTLAEAIQQVLEGLEAYLATGFEADGGSIEGISYWNYGLMYTVTFAELLRERTGGEIDFLANPRLADIARYPLATALSPEIYVNFGDANEKVALQPGVVTRLAERAGRSELRGLLVSPDRLEGMGVSAAKLAIILRDIAWWDGKTSPFPQAAYQDFFLPEAGVAKFCGATPDGRKVILAAKAGHNDGHHSHTDIGTFIYHLNGDTLLCDPGRGLYSREYFRQQRYENVFNNSYSHSVPRIGGKLQAPGPEFGGRQQYHGTILTGKHGKTGKLIQIDFEHAYDLPELTKACRKFIFDPVGGKTRLEDTFEFDAAALEIEEAFMTWNEVVLVGSQAILNSGCSAIALSITEPAGAAFTAQSLEAECRANQREGVLTRLAVLLPAGSRRFVMEITPNQIKEPR